MNTYANPLMQLGLGMAVPGAGQVFQTLGARVQKEIERSLTPGEQIAVRQGGAASRKAREVIGGIVEHEHLASLANPSLGVWPEETDEEIARRLYRVLYGLGPIEILLEDPEVEDIAVNGPQEIFVRTSRGWSEIPTDTVTDLASNSEGMLFMFNQAISASGQQAGPLSPVIDERLPGGHRIAIIAEPVAADGVWPLVVIRRHREVAFSPMDFIKKPVKAQPPRVPEIIDATGEWAPGSLLTPASLAFLEMAVLSGMNILLLGRTGVGKTAFLSMLGQMIPPDRRVVVLEDTPRAETAPGSQTAKLRLSHHRPGAPGRWRPGAHEQAGHGCPASASRPPGLGRSTRARDVGFTKRHADRPRRQPDEHPRCINKRPHPAHPVHGLPASGRGAPLPGGGGQARLVVVPRPGELRHGLERAALYQGHLSLHRSDERRRARN